MATIAGSSKYGEGHPVILKEQNKLSPTARQKFNALGYQGGKTVFTLVRNLGKQKVAHAVELSKGNADIFMKDPRGKIIMVRGTPNAINATFNHHGKTGKSLTNKLTEIKENISMWMFQSAIENGKMMTEDEVIKKLGNDKDHYATVYYTSAVKQATELKKIIKQKGYHYERQAEDLTKKLYAVATKLAKKQKDNWNPADVWMIHKTYDMKKLYGANNINELNDEIAVAYKNKKIIPISLKQVTANTADLELVDPASAMTKKLDIDFTIQRIMLTESFANFTIETKSGFTVRGGYKGSEISLSVSLEGKMAGAGYQLGAIDAKAYPSHIYNNYRYTLRNGTPVVGAEHLEAKKELKEMFAKYRKLSAKIDSYEDAISRYNMGDDLVRNRFSNIVSYMYSFLMAPRNQREIEENLKYCYYSSKKISGVGCMYVVIK